LIHRNASRAFLRDRYSIQRRKRMSVNMGSIDRAVRIVLGLILIAYAIPLGFAATGWNWVGWIGVVPLTTAFFGVCPLYSVLGISTCPIKRA
jgi:hypothetical protein